MCNAGRRERAALPASTCLALVQAYEIVITTLHNRSTNITVLGERILKEESCVGMDPDIFQNDLLWGFTRKFLSLSARRFALCALPLLYNQIRRQKVLQVEFPLRISAFYARPT